MINNERILMNKSPEQIARDNIDDQLEQTGWLIQDRNKIKLAPDCAVAVREYPTDSGPAPLVSSGI